MRNDLIHAKREFKDIRHIVEYAAETYGENTAFSFKKSPRDKEIVKVSYIQFRDDVRALATEMISRGMMNKHVAVVAKMSYDFAVAYYATILSGGVFVPLDKEWGAEELADTVKNADAEYLLCDKDIVEKGEKIKELAGIANDIVYLCAEGEGTLEAWRTAGAEKFADDSKPYFECSYDKRKLSLLVFTSGTTGKGKGVMLCSEAIIRDMADIVHYIDFAKKTVSVLPPHHTYGSTVMLIGHVMIGTEIYISDGLKYVQKELKAEKPGHLILVPLYLETFYRKIQANIKAQGKEKLVKTMMKISNLLLKVGIDLRRKLFGAIRDAFGGEVSMIITGGAPVNPEIVAFFQGIGISTLNGYGITECAPLIAVNRSRHIVPGSVGSVLDMDEVRIDEPNEDGEGEILVKGPNVMLGYYKNEEATREAITEEGFFRTGDYGKLTKDNILFITGRKKNLIILSNGKNVYPEEIENELVSAPGVQDIIVYEGKSKRGMEFNDIVAEIYPDKEYIDKNGITDIYAHLKQFVDEYNKTAVSYKKIGILKVRDEDFPKNTLRKIMRFKLDMTID